VEQHHDGLADQQRHPPQPLTHDWLQPLPHRKRHPVNDTPQLPSNTPKPDLLTRIQIWWVVKTPREQALIALIAYSVFLIATNGLSFWSINGNSDSGVYDDLFVLHLYLWCVGITGWCLYGWTKNHPIARNHIILSLIFGALALAIVIAMVIMAASGSHGGNNSNRNNTGTTNNYYYR
jgi:hypothetical protein